MADEQHIAKSPPPPPNPPSTTYLPYHPPNTSHQPDRHMSDPAGPDPSEFAPIANAFSNAMHPITSNHQSSSATLGANASLEVGGKITRTKTGKTFTEVERPVPKVDSSPRWCRFCEIYKPDRTHHCRHCGTCVMQFDRESLFHFFTVKLIVDHCVWIGQCVGWANHKVGHYPYLELTAVLYHLQLLGSRILHLHTGVYGYISQKVG
jgi:palmitoyltransferase